MKKIRSFSKRNKDIFYIAFGVITSIGIIGGIFYNFLYHPNIKEILINSDSSAYKSPGSAAFSSDINPYLHIEKKEKPFIIREWDDTWGFNVSSYDCLYAWPKTEKHSIPADESFDYVQSKTWSIHPKPSSKAAGIAFVLLSTEKVVVKNILLHLSNFKAAPILKQFRFVRISEICGGTGGSSTPRIIFKPIFLTPDIKTYFPKVFKAPDAEGGYVTSLPYQMDSDESLSFGFNFYGGSGDYEVIAEIMATDFSGRDYNVTTPAVRFKRLIVKEKELAALSILKEVAE